MRSIKSLLLVLLFGSSLLAEQTPREVAELALKAWNAHDPKLLTQLADPELKARARSARLSLFYVSHKPEKKPLLTTGSDAEVMTVLCEALDLIVPPRPPELEYFDTYLSTREKGDLVIVSFDSGVKRRSDNKIINKSVADVVLKRSQTGVLLLLWSPSIQLHFDLEWDPRNPE